MEKPSPMEKKDKPSSEPEGFEEDDIIDLSDTLQDEEIIDLTDPEDPVPGDESEELIDLDTFLSDKDNLSVEEAETEKVLYEEIADDGDDIIELVEHVDDDEEDIIELVDELGEDGVQSSAFSSDMDDDVIDLVDSVTQIIEKDQDIVAPDADGDDTIDLVEPVTESMAVNHERDDDIIELDVLADQAFDDLDDDIIDLTRTVDEEFIIELDNLVNIEPDEDPDDDIIDLTGTVDSDDIIDLETLADAEVPADNDDDIIELETLVDEGALEELNDDTIDLTQRIDDSDIIDLEEPLDALPEEGFDEDIIDLTEALDDDGIIELAHEMAVSDDVEEDLIELTDAVTESDDHQLTGFFDFGDDETVPPDDKSEEPVLLDEIIDDIDAVDEEVIDLTESAGISEDHDFEETVQDYDGKIRTDHGFTEFAEQTTDNLQLDLSETLPGETSRHSIINAEPVKEAFDFESFAEQTMDSESFKALLKNEPRVENLKKDQSPLVSERDINHEIMNLSLDDESIDGFDDSDVSGITSGHGVDEADDRGDESSMEATDVIEMMVAEVDAAPDESFAAMLNTHDSGPSSLGVTQDQLDLAVERVIRKLYAEKLDGIFREVIGRSISEDIERIKEVLKK